MMTIVLTTLTTMIINSDDYVGDVVADQTNLGTEPVSNYVSNEN